MLFGQDFGGCHQRALPACVHAQCGCQRGHHGFARAHIALEQTVHGHGAGHVGRDLGAHTLLGAGQCKGQGVQETLVQRAGAAGRGQYGRFERCPGASRLQLRELLGQEFFRFEPLPCRVAVVHQRVHRDVRPGVVQKRQGLMQRP